MAIWNAHDANGACSTKHHPPHPQREVSNSQFGLGCDEPTVWDLKPHGLRPSIRSGFASIDKMYHDVMNYTVGQDLHHACSWSMQLLSQGIREIARTRALNTITARSHGFRSFCTIQWPLPLQERKQLQQPNGQEFVYRRKPQEGYRFTAWVLGFGSGFKLQNA